ncbi:MAG: DUF3570 domain-containing protein [Polyangiales bacterium]
MSCSLGTAAADWVPRARLETAGYADTDHVSVVTPAISGSVEEASRGIRFGGSYLVDVVSAASVDIVSTASKRWTEVRQAGTFDARYKPHDIGIAGGGYASIEPDYHSYGVNGAFTYDFDSRAHTFSLGYGYSHDLSGRAGTPFDLYGNIINKHTLTPSLTLTLDRSTLLSILVDASFERGDSSKPYRYVPFFDPGLQVPVGSSVDKVNELRRNERALEHLPTSRDRFALSGRLLHRWDHVTLRINERIYSDSWGLLASTTDLRLPVDVGEHMRIFPHARLHTQRGVSFWNHAYRINSDGSYPNFWAGDRELGPLRTYTLGGGGAIDLGRYSLSAQIDGMHTQFLQALYITDRSGILVSIAIDAGFE